jgi:selenocysteine lyase/cysteine desulfurase
MKADRKGFIRRLGVIGLGAFSLPFPDRGLFAELNSELIRLGPETGSEVGNDEFWDLVRASFMVPEGFINLENGYFSPQPIPVLEAFLEDTRRINQRTSHYMRREQERDWEGVRQDIASFAGWDPEEVALTRNTTESLNILINGLDLKAGDEVITTIFDYGSMQEALDQRARREGIVVNEIDLPILPESNEQLVDLFRKAITPRTKAMLVTQLINLNGQILPTRELCALGRERGIEVIVDAAHAFAHLDHRPADLNADLYGTSLHKWLSAPLGNGLLRVKKEKIAGIWPLMGDAGRARDDIRKFEHQGTRPPAAWLSIREAIRFHHLIGTSRKAARLDYLKRYWAEQVAEHPRIRLNTSLKPGHSSSIGHVSVAGLGAKELMDRLLDEHGIFTVAVVRGPLSGVRVTPHLYNTTAELDALVKALRTLAG